MFVACSQKFNSSRNNYLDDCSKLEQHKAYTLKYLEEKYECSLNTKVEK